jgi:hypothetical protein
MIEIESHTGCFIGPPPDGLEHSELVEDEIVELLDDLFSAAAEFDTDKLAAIMHPDIRFSEVPNLINPGGSERGWDEALAGFEKAAGRWRRRARS